MNRSREEFLAGTALALNQNSAITFRNIGKDAKEVLHPVILADYILATVSAFNFLSKLFDQAHITECFHTSNNLSIFIF
ncbi:hypothetical protein ES705_38514 [subsurface metagenome]